MDLPYDNLLKGIVYALNYDYRDDEDAVKKNDMLKSMDLTKALSEITGLDKNLDALKIIAKAYKNGFK